MALVHSTAADKAFNGTYRVLIVFANAASGSHFATNLLRTAGKQLVLSSSETQIDVFLFNWLDDKERCDGIRFILGLTQRYMPHQLDLRLVIAAGDGTPSWIFAELLQKNIDLSRLAFGVAPLGSGCDLSRVLGYRGPHGPVMQLMYAGRLSEALSKYVDAETRSFDVWDVTIVSEASNGCFRRVTISDRSHASAIERAQGLVRVPVQKLSLKMNNYFSIGIQGRVGIAFDKSRRHSPAGNKTMYAWHSVTEGLFKRSPRLKRLLHSVELLANPAAGRDNDTILFTVSDEMQERCLAAGIEAPHLRGNPVELMLMNIPGIWGRAVDLWGDATRGTGLTNGSLLEDTNSEKWTRRSFGDGKLEMFCMPHKASFLSKQMAVFRRHLHRVAQTSGPLRFRFQEQSQVVYLMCDGEFYEAVNPSYMIVSLAAKTHAIVQPDLEYSDSPPSFRRSV
eukprot:GILK01010255.1.p1 GENE.GILK01010255.1~~GILK01010255.1.p1  ORF type:complete len:451 (+),score=31.10 GILK01010255.1:77-1429(+)